MGWPITEPCTIYAIKCKDNGRIYVGRTQRDVAHRVREHFYELRNGEKRNVRGASSWQYDFDRYGVSGFEYYILETNVPPEEADERENYYIDLYKSTLRGFGYNKKLNYIQGQGDCACDFAPGVPKVPDAKQIRAAGMESEAE